MQGTLEQLRIPYTGSGVMASALAMDKTTTKLIWEAVGLPTPKYRKLAASSDSAAVCQELGLPLIVKPAHEGSTIGLTKVTDVAQLPEAYALASRLDPDVLAEEFIDGRELTCAVLEIDGEPVALPLVEIVAPGCELRLPDQVFQRRCSIPLSGRFAAGIDGGNTGSGVAKLSGTELSRLGACRSDAATV